MIMPGKEWATVRSVYWQTSVKKICIPTHVESFVSQIILMTACSSLTSHSLSDGDLLCDRCILVRSVSDVFARLQGFLCKKIGVDFRLY